MLVDAAAEIWDVLGWVQCLKAIEQLLQDVDSSLLRMNRAQSYQSQ